MSRVTSVRRQLVELRGGGDGGGDDDNGTRRARARGRHGVLAYRDQMWRDFRSFRCGYAQFFRHFSGMWK